MHFYNLKVLVVHIVNITQNRSAFHEIITSVYHVEDTFLY
jgi:hypothetical protein